MIDTYFCQFSSKSNNRKRYGNFNDRRNFFIFLNNAIFVFLLFVIYEQEKLYHLGIVLKSC